MGASYPKPTDSRVTRHVQRFDWVDLPAKRTGAAPKLPGWRTWRPETRKWWSALWTKPQATLWDQSGSSLWVLATLYDDLIGGVDAVRVSAEIRQIEDRHGLTAKALMQLRWRVASGDESAAPVSARPAAGRRERLRVVV
jgi:hypothetical protein